MIFINTTKIKNMKITHYNDEIKIEKDAYLWRYMSFEKLYSFIHKKEIYFNRLDKFDDILEGLPKSAKSRILLLPVTNETFGTSKTDSDIIAEYDGWRKSKYASCWYLTENTSIQTDNSNHSESLAMWNLYANSTFSFVVKIPFNPLLKAISDSLNDIQDVSFDEAHYGKIKYESNPILLRKPNSEATMSGLVKDISYKHENELRFILSKSKKDSKNENGILLDIKKQFNELLEHIEVFSHPKMQFAAFEMFEKDFKEKYNINLQKSKLII